MLLVIAPVIPASVYGWEGHAACVVVSKHMSVFLLPSTAAPPTKLKAYQWLPMSAGPLTPLNDEYGASPGAERAVKPQKGLLLVSASVRSTHTTPAVKS